MISAEDASLTVWTQSQMVTKSFVCMCMQGFSNEHMTTDGRKIERKMENDSWLDLMDGKTLWSS